MPEQQRAKHVRKGLYLEYVTISYNVLEGLVAVIAGYMSGSTALIGFGIDSAIEVTSGASLVWRLHSDAQPSRREKAERDSLRIVGVSFILLAIYVAADAAVSLVTSEPPEESWAGIVLALFSIAVMPLLAKAKRRIAAQIGSSALTADAKQTELCTYLSVILLAGLLLNALFGWGWADPVAALIMVPIIAKEGIDALRGKTCCGSCH
ncbi:MAG: cation transporter [Bryobacteraceae bacterium]|nr:cation transporter [Bryobacteraceae bacterium]